MNSVTMVISKTMVRLIAATVLIAIPGMLAQPSAEASIEFELDFEFSGAQEPAGATPWLTATFDDSFGGASTVRLTMSATNLVGTEFVDEWIFNFDPSLDPTLLTFSAVDNSDSVPIIPTITSADMFKADGDGFFDIMFDFPNDKGDVRFTAGEEVKYDITYTAPITELSFDFNSTLGGGAGSYLTAAHVQGIASGSGWIGPDGDNGGGGNGVIPEPVSLVVWGLLGTLGLAVGHRRRRVS